uniref:Uncharacterized protein n=1 Tax=Alexandrium monilatum TaxID=311494 RepID=A0A6T1IAH2_9DINO|mmetsp:Transcript_65813/g.207893  ORF Transcript_65813/g.207893 Transcript_65813/m.207893 type:complete len:181 (+) Transcript_65813:406-948(+)
MEGAKPRIAALAPCHKLNAATSSCRLRRRAKNLSISRPRAEAAVAEEPEPEPEEEEEAEGLRQAAPPWARSGAPGGPCGAARQAGPGILGGAGDAEGARRAGAEAAEPGRAWDAADLGQGVLGVAWPPPPPPAWPRGEGAAAEDARCPLARRSFTARRLTWRSSLASPQASARTCRAKKP